MKAINSPKAQTNKTTYMSDEAFGDLKEALEDALAFEHGERRDLSVTRIQGPAPKASPQNIRRKLDRLTYCSGGAVNASEHETHKRQDVSGVKRRS